MDPSDQGSGYSSQLIDATAMRLLGLCLASALGALIMLAAPAQQFPNAQLRIISPHPPGGGNDILARLLGQKLNESWGQPVVTDNRAGANGTVGTAIVAKSLPDGYTLLLVPSGFAVNPSMYPKLPYNAEKAFAPVTAACGEPIAGRGASIAAGQVDQRSRRARKSAPRTNQLRVFGHWLSTAPRNRALQNDGASEHGPHSL